MGDNNGATETGLGLPFGGDIYIGCHTTLARVGNRSLRACPHEAVKTTFLRPLHTNGERSTMVNPQSPILKGLKELHCTFTVDEPSDTDV
ncbi:unnamed protein product [Dibothriocephalus latus]|uniref:Uncharacterized protein n=1 Tax=Dibothriocephalus latus TaxID=60516 RepID=A0A3P7Q1I0_DIBLA|nr:unnamed protein product [Dibothriocephalus latus]